LEVIRFLVMTVFLCRPLCRLEVVAVFDRSAKSSGKNFVSTYGNNDRLIGYICLLTPK